MKLIFPKIKMSDPELVIRRSGYGKIFDRRSGETSYVRRLSSDLYPRFHVYILEEGGNFVFNLHLDQRATRYEGVTAHSGEYDGAVVEGEGEHIRQIATSVLR